MTQKVKTLLQRLTEVIFAAANKQADMACVQQPVSCNL